MIVKVVIGRRLDGYSVCVTVWPYEVRFPGGIAILRVKLGEKLGRKGEKKA